MAYGMRAMRWARVERSAKGRSRRAGQQSKAAKQMMSKAIWTQSVTIIFRERVGVLTMISSSRTIAKKRYGAAVGLFGCLKRAEKIVPRKRPCVR